MSARPTLIKSEWNWREGDRQIKSARSGNRWQSGQMTMLLLGHHSLSAGKGEEIVSEKVRECMDRAHLRPRGLHSSPYNVFSELIQSPPSSSSSSLKEEQSNCLTDTP